MRSRLSMPSDSPLHSARPLGTLPLLERSSSPTSEQPPAFRAGRRTCTPRIAARRKKSLVFLDLTEVWAFESDARLTFVYSAAGKFDIDVSLAEIESSPVGHLFVRVQRSWLANLAFVKQLDRSSYPRRSRGRAGARDGGEIHRGHSSGK